MGERIERVVEHQTRAWNITSFHDGKPVAKIAIEQTPGWRDSFTVTLTGNDVWGEIRLNHDAVNELATRMYNLGDIRQSCGVSTRTVLRACGDGDGVATHDRYIQIQTAQHALSFTKGVEVTIREADDDSVVVSGIFTQDRLRGILNSADATAYNDYDRHGEAPNAEPDPAD
jgi:hypothetical protein